MSDPATDAPEERSILDPLTGAMVKISERLTDRLRGRYAVGPTLPNGEPEFGWRDHPVPPIQIEAAAEIDQLRARIAAQDAARVADGARIERLEEVLRSTGVCMSCIFGAYEPCTDCLGAGWDNGNDPHEEARTLRADLAAAQARAQIADAETVQTLLDLLNPLHGDLDNHLFDERKNEELEIPRDREYSVNITEAQERDLTQAVLILEDRARQFHALAAKPDGGTNE